MRRERGPDACQNLPRTCPAEPGNCQEPAAAGRDRHFACPGPAWGLPEPARTCPRPPRPVASEHALGGEGRDLLVRKAEHPAQTSALSWPTVWGAIERTAPGVRESLGKTFCMATRPSAVGGG